jgi:dipeptidyl-peptidase III
MVVSLFLFCITLAPLCGVCDQQEAMLDKMAASFEVGSQDLYIDASREWVRDQGPAVESYMGFVESYRDPVGTRGEWEGFVAVVNKATSAKFGALVAGSEHFLRLLPWGAAFEKDAFLRPDFTALEVMAFAGSGIPAGEKGRQHAHLLH